MEKMVSEQPIVRVEGLGEVIEELRRADGFSIVLVGSAARNVRAEGSDIDLLLIGTERPKVPRQFPGYHIQTSSMAEFIRNLENGEDFESWCVRLGIPIYDCGLWIEILNSKGARQWPRWELKISHGARRLFLAQSMLEMGDHSAATEELLYTVGHIARGLLLKAGVFPLSRPELAEQLRSIGYPHLAKIHEELRGDEIKPSLLRQTRNYSKKLLCHLDRDVYAACSEEQRLRKQSKKRPASSA